MTAPMIDTFDNKLQAYSHDAAMKSHAIAHDLDYETHVHPWKGGWRVVVFDHTPQVADVAAAVPS